MAETAKEKRMREAKEALAKRIAAQKEEMEKRDISHMFKPGSGVNKAADVPKVTQGKTSKSEAEKLKGRKDVESVIKKRKKYLQGI